MKLRLALAARAVITGPLMLAVFQGNAAPAAVADEFVAEKRATSPPDRLLL